MDRELENSYYIKSRYKKFIEHLKHAEDSTVRVKVFLSYLKKGDYVFSKSTHLRKIIPELEKNKVYQLDLYYKENGDYILSDLCNLFVMLNSSDKIVFFEYENRHWFVSQYKYLRECSNFLLLGYAKKKIFIRETNKKFYDIHIYSNSIMNDQKVDIDKKLFLVGSESIDISYEVYKLLKKYIYQIDSIVYNGSSKQHLELDIVNTVEVEVRIERKKTIRERLKESFHV